MSSEMQICLAVVIGYLFGCVNPAYIMGRLRGFDIREKGTGNAGASNTMLTMGWGAAVIVCAYDICKAALACLVVSYLFPGSLTLRAIAGCSAIMGHNFPFYLGFRGGKGFASYVGLTLALDFKTALIIIIVALIGAAITRWIVTATFTVTFAFPIYEIVTKAEIGVIIALCTTTLIIFIKHIPNIIRFLRKEESGIDKKPVGIKLLKDKPTEA